MLEVRASRYEFGEDKIQSITPDDSDMQPLFLCHIKSLEVNFLGLELQGLGGGFNRVQRPRLLLTSCFTIRRPWPWPSKLECGNSSRDIHLLKRQGKESNTPLFLVS